MLGSRDDTHENNALPFADYFARARQHVEDGYGVKVSVQPVPNEYKADLNGNEILIDPSNDDADRLFILLHCFGHTVQWNTDPRSLEVLSNLSPPLPAGQLPEIEKYEREAARLGLTLLHEIGVEDADQWL